MTLTMSSGSVSEEGEERAKGNWRREGLRRNLADGGEDGEAKAGDGEPLVPAPTR